MQIQISDKKAQWLIIFHDSTLLLLPYWPCFHASMLLYFCASVLPVLLCFCIPKILHLVETKSLKKKKNNIKKKKPKKKKPHKNLPRMDRWYILSPHRSKTRTNPYSILPYPFHWNSMLWCRASTTTPCHAKKKKQAPRPSFQNSNCNFQFQFHKAKQSSAQQSKA